MNVVSSGRDWVQQIVSKMGLKVSVSSFFQALRSRRRLAFSREVAEHIRKEVDQVSGSSWDPLAAHPELEGFEVYASDGHYEAAASHMPKVRGRSYASGYFFSLNLRSHSLSLLDVARPECKNNLREHDMAALKRLSTEQLRLGAPKGIRVIHAYDAASIDYRQWLKWKTRGIYLISREKANSRVQVIGVRDFDRNDPRNNGVLSDEHIGVFAGVLLRRVVYQEPLSAEIFSFHTSEFTLPPGLISFIYKLRWDIEKCFDEKKNKLQEKKAWATTSVARAQQALFVCMAHNLMVLLERDLEHNESIRDEKSYAKRRKRLEAAKREILAAGRVPNPLVVNCTRVSQRSLQFIRWLRTALVSSASWDTEISQLRPLMAKYMS